MNNLSNEELQALKRVTATVYLCQALSFIFATLPLLVGLAFNLYRRKEVQETWLESHFKWQIKTCWVTLLGILISAITFGTGIGIFTLFTTILWLVYRITMGWLSLTDGEPINKM